MKNQKKNLAAVVLSAACGALVGWLRMKLVTDGLDEKGLLIPGNPLNYAMWAAVIAFLAAAFLVTRRVEGGSFGQSFPACKLRAVLSVGGGAVLAVLSAQTLQTQRLMGILGLAAGVCMAVPGLLRWSGKQPSPLFHCVVCVFFIVRLILSFQIWGADPQIQNYALQLMASVCLMLLAFHRASCDAGLINRRRTALFSLAAVFFCAASLTDETAPLFYAACGLWAVGVGGTMEKLPETTGEQ